jgi:hypothetical protein
MMDESEAEAEAEVEAPPAKKAAAPVATKGGTVAYLEEPSAETAFAIFDPLNLATSGSESTLRFFRHAEIKHGRVAMAAAAGLLVHVSHVHFPGYVSLSSGVTFEDLSNMGPFEAWNNVPLLGQVQIFLAIAGFEFRSEMNNPEGHYMRTGTPGDLKFVKLWGDVRFWDTVGFTNKLSPEKLAEKRLSEVKNGRLAMLGMMSVCASMAIPGSVPALTGANGILTGTAFAAPFAAFAQMSG